VAQPNHAERQAKLRTALAGASLDALLVTAMPNVRYLCGFSGSSGMLVVTHDRCVLITDFRYAVQSREQSAHAADVIIEGTSLWARLWTTLAELKVGAIGFESAHVTHADAMRFLEGGARHQWRPAVNLVEVLREQKDASEVAAIRAAVAIAERALERTIAQVRVGMTEMAIGGRLEFELREAGSEAFPFETIVASGERSALPHARCSSRAVKPGDFLLIDYGAVSDGYCSDITRTFSMGSANAEMREVYAVVREANATASGGVRAGMRGKDADALARNYIERRGLGAEFGHSLGHGIGLEVHESPRLSKAADAPLPAQSVVTIEPGVYRDGWGGVRIEDDVLLTTEGPVVLTSFTRELLEL